MERVVGEGMQDVGYGFKSVWRGDIAQNQQFRLVLAV